MDDGGRTNRSDTPGPRDGSDVGPDSERRPVWSRDGGTGLRQVPRREILKGPVVPVTHGPKK